MYDEIADVDDEMWLKITRRLGVQKNFTILSTPKGRNWLTKFLSAPECKKIVDDYHQRMGWMDPTPGGVLTVPELTPEKMEELRKAWETRHMATERKTKDCKSCEAPVDVDGPQHQSAGDCRAAQRKEIRRLRKENERLRGVVNENQKMSKLEAWRSMYPKEDDDPDRRLLDRMVKINGRWVLPQ